MWVLFHWEGRLLSCVCVVLVSTHLKYCIFLESINFTLFGEQERNFGLHKNLAKPLGVEREERMIGLHLGFGRVYRSCVYVQFW